MARYTDTERIGVNATEGLIINEIKWIFREQPIIDMGIDAQIESIENGNPTGKLIGVQIKTGLSHFTSTQDFLIYYGNITHLEYWLNHSLPVILVAHLPETKKTYWVQVSEENIVRTKKHWKANIPKNQPLNSDSVDLLKVIAEGTKEEKRQRQLFLDKQLMKLLADGGKLYVKTQEWHNKSLGRSPFHVIYKDDQQKEIVEKKWFVWYTCSLESILKHFFPWADISIDHEFYEKNFSDSFYDVYTDLYLQDNKIYPYEVLSGEVSNYRLELKLNELGKSFIKVLNYTESN